MQLFLLLVLLSNLLIPATSVAGSLFSTLTSSEKNYWHKILHADQNGKSRADGQLFFFSPDGKKNSELEFLATMDAFKKDTGEAGWFHYHPQCVFRERFRFIKELGLLNNIPEKNCAEFDEWKKGLNAESVSLIFSSSYPNNPSSLFGHTLIRLNQKNKKNDLLDYSIAFSAIPNYDDIGIVYAYKGLFGGYQGILDVSKYYLKVNDYNNGESRDLIEYKLKMSPEQIDRLINHLWEIYQTTYFDYFFFDENCSSVLADILAVPFDQILVNKHKRWYYLPSELVKSFSNQNLIESVHFRPSLKKKLEKRLSYLDSTELAQVKNLEYEKSLKVHDGVINYLDFRRYRTKDKLTDHEKLTLRKALIKRSTLPQAETENETYSENNRPDLGHNPQKISLFARNNPSQLGLELKEGHHDLMSNDLGFDSYSQFDFLTATAIYDKSLKKILFDQFTLVDLISLHPFRFYDPQFSWEAKTGSDSENSVLAHAFGGLTFKPINNSVFSVMLGSNIFIDGQYQKNYKLLPALKTIFITNLGTFFKLGFFNELRAHENLLTLKLTYFPSQNTEIRLTGLKKGLQLNYGFYF